MERVFLHLLNMSISAAYMVLAVAVLRLLLKKAPKWISCVLWGLVGLRLLLPVPAESVLSLVPSAETVPENIIYSSSPAITSGSELINSSINPGLSKALAPDPADSANPAQIFTCIASWVWAAGTAAMLLYALISFIRMRRSLRTAVRLRDNVWQSESVPTPFVLGLLKPEIYVPFGIGAEELESVLAHERAHIERRDHWIKPIGFALLSIYWFNPVIWLAYILLCRDIELACDERVIKHMDMDQRKSYSRALLKFSGMHRGIAACPLAFGEVGAKRRIKSVLSYKRPAIWLAAAAAAICALVAVCFLTDPAAPKFDPDRDEITSVQLTDATVSAAPAAADMNESQIQELAYRLHNMRKVRRGDAYGKMTPLYSMHIYLKDGDSIVIRGYSRAGDMLDMVRSGRTYRIADREFQKYVLNICSGGDTAPAVNVSGYFYGGDLRCQNYVFASSVYISPFMSYMPRATTGYRYIVSEDSFAVQDMSGGTTVQYYPDLNWSWQELTQAQFDEISDANQFTKDGDYNIDISAYGSPRILELGAGRSLMDMGGQLWFMDGGYIYRLKSEEEAYTELARADIDHDGVRESIRLCLPDDGNCALCVFDDENIQTWVRTLSTSHAGWDTLFLCRIDGMDYLLSYKPYISTGTGNYRYELFYLPDSEWTLVRENEIEFSLMPSGDMDAEGMAAFAGEVNGFIAAGSMLLSTEDGQLSIGPENGEDWLESYSFLDECSELYSEGDTLQERINIYRQYISALAAG